MMKLLLVAAFMVCCSHGNPTNPILDELKAIVEKMDEIKTELKDEFPAKLTLNDGSDDETEKRTVCENAIEAKEGAGYCARLIEGNGGVAVCSAPKYNAYILSTCAKFCALGPCKGGPKPKDPKPSGATGVLKADCVKAHNYLRGKHANTVPVEWDAALAAGAQSWAEHLAAINKMKHSVGGDFGENLYWSSGKTDCFKAANYWYEEINYYSYATTMSKYSNKDIRHFTQVVWAATTKIGVGMAGGYVVGRYQKQGNFVSNKIGEEDAAAHKRVFGANVKPLIASDVEEDIEALFKIL